MQRPAENKGFWVWQIKTGKFFDLPEQSCQPFLFRCTIPNIWNAVPNVKLTSWVAACNRLGCCTLTRNHCMDDKKPRLIIEPIDGKISQNLRITGVYSRSGDQAHSFTGQGFAVRVTYLPPHPNSTKIECQKAGHGAATHTKKNQYLHHFHFHI